MEDLVTIGNTLSISFSMDPLLILKKLGVLFKIKKLMFRNLYSNQFLVDLNTNYDNVYYSSNCSLRGKGLNPFKK